MRCSIAIALCACSFAGQAAAQAPAPQPAPTQPAPTQPTPAPPAEPPSAPTPPPPPVPVPPPAPPPATGWDAPGQPLPPVAPTPTPYPPFGQSYGYRPWTMPVHPPRVLPAVEGRSPPPGYRPEQRIRRGMVIGGAVTFGVLYLATVVAGGFLQESAQPDRFAPLFVPVAGPFVTLGTADPAALPSVLLAIDGIAQALGLGLTIGGVIHPEEVWVRDELALTLAPIVIQGAPAGVGLSSRW